MWIFILRCIGEGILTLVALSLVVFGSVHLTGDPTSFLIPISEAHDEKVYEAQLKAMGLDRPFIVQYADFLTGATPGFPALLVAMLIVTLIGTGLMGVLVAVTATA